MSAAQTKEHEEDKHTGMQEKIRKVWSKAKKKKTYSRRLHSNKSSRLYYNEYQVIYQTIPWSWKSTSSLQQYVRTLYVGSEFAPLRLSRLVFVLNCTSLANSCVQLLTSNRSPRNWGTLLIKCVKLKSVTCAPGGANLKCTYDEMYY